MSRLEKFLFGKPEVGDSVVTLDVSTSAARRNPPFVQETVVKVGRKYFTTEVSGKLSFRTQFHIDDWNEKTDYSVKVMAYPSREVYDQERHSMRLHKSVQEMFEPIYNYHRFPLSVLKKICGLLEIT